MIYLIYYSLKVITSICNMNYFLSEETNNSINKWKQSTNKLLFISGDYSVGKTSLAYELYDNRDIIHINAEMLKNNSDMGEYIKNIVTKKSIQMMYKRPSFIKNIIIDDLDLFYKHDKVNYKNIIDVLTLNKYKMIIILRKSLLTNKYIKKILPKNYHVNICYKKNEVAMIISKWCTSQNKKLSSEKMMKIIAKCGYNIRYIKIAIENDIHNELVPCNKNHDKYDIVEQIFNKSDMSINDIINLVYVDYNINILNVIENSLPHIDNKYILSIYDKCIDMDIIDTFSISNCLWSSFTEYSIIYSVVYIYYIIHHHQINIKVDTITYNKYISKSIINISKSNIYNYKYEPIYLFFSLILLDIQVDVDKDISTKYINAHIISYNWLYNKNITKKNINNLIKT